ncbi:MAG: chemotaxis protein CheV [Helicobacteraceae bacterium]|jgi:two-component system chemotaxis response regulator CheV|nr:chemotaxis protein CheV [Helicobacteraceae bacterium]
MSGDFYDLHADISKMTESHLKNVMQLAVFYTGANEIYAVNVAKIQNFVILDEIEIVPNHEKNSIIVGVSRIREELVTFVNLDLWLGNDNVDFSVFSVGIVCNVNNRRIGFFVKEIIGIEDRFSDELQTADTNKLKILYITSIMLEGRERACAIFDIERLMSECGFPMEKLQFILPAEAKDKFVDKKFLVAEDSAIAAKKLQDFFISLGVDYELYKNGEDLIKRLNMIPSNELACVITDLEMPIKDGFQVISFMRNETKFKEIPIVVNSSMTSGGVIEKVKRLGANEFINKSDIYSLYEFIKKYLKKGEDD